MAYADSRICREWCQSVYAGPASDHRVWIKDRSSVVVPELEENHKLYRERSTFHLSWLNI